MARPDRRLGEPLTSNDAELRRLGFQSTIRDLIQRFETSQGFCGSLGAFRCGAGPICRRWAAFRRSPTGDQTRLDRSRRTRRAARASRGRAFRRRTERPSRRDRAHASGPCQNHRGLAFIAAAIMGLTSPDTASLSPWGERAQPPIFRDCCIDRFILVDDDHKRYRPDREASGGDSEPRWPVGAAAARFSVRRTDRPPRNCLGCRTAERAAPLQ